MAAVRHPPVCPPRQSLCLVVGFTSRAPPLATPLLNRVRSQAASSARPAAAPAAPAAPAGSAVGAAAAQTPTVHANSRVGVAVDMDGGYRDPGTGRWVGNGTWVTVWNGFDTGSYDGSHWYGVPDDQQEAQRKLAQEKAAAEAASGAAGGGGASAGAE